MAKNPLEEAELLWRRKNWKGLISLLDPLSELYRDNARYNTLLGIAFLYKEDIGGAYSCLRRAQNLDYRDMVSALALAVVFIRRGETDKALQLYVDILERQAKNKKAKQGLSFLKRYGSDAESKNLRKLKQLYPGPAVRPFLLLCLIIAFAMIISSYFWGPKLIEFVKISKPERMGISDIVLSADEAASPIGFTESFEIILTEKEALETFDKAKALFLAYRDEAALVELNRLRLSNASRQIKAKVEALALYVREPSFASMPDKFSFKEVAAFPGLYEGVSIIWKGLPANIIIDKEKAYSFDLLVGYQDKKKLEGIVNVRITFATKLEADRPIEVLAKIRNVSNSFFLECTAIHEL